MNPPPNPPPVQSFHAHLADASAEDRLAFAICEVARRHPDRTAIVTAAGDGGRTTDYGTLAAAIALGLRLWIPGALIWAVGHTAAVWAAKRDPQFVDVVRRHLRIPGHLSV